MTVTLHKNMPLADMHGLTALEYADAAARTAVTLTSAHKYKVACQLDTGALYVVLQQGASYGWVKMCDGPTFGPTGTDYGALAASNSMTVNGYWRGDYGVSGSSGTGSALWTNISGAHGNITPDASATNGIGAISTGLNGKASILTDGSTQMGKFTGTAIAAPGTTNHHVYMIGRQRSGGSSSPRNILADGSNVTNLYMSTGIAINMVPSGGAAMNLTSGITDDQWVRIRLSYTNTASADEMRVGANSVTGTSANTAPGTARTVGSLLLKWEWLLYMEMQGPKANFLTFAGLADTAARSVDWTTAIVI